MKRDLILCFSIFIDITLLGDIPLFQYFSSIPSNETQWVLSVQERQIWWREAEYEWYYKILYVGLEQLVVLGAAPLALLVYYNFSIHAAFTLPQNIEIQAAEEIVRNSREKKLSKVLITIVIVFLCCHSTRIFWYIYYSVSYENIVNCPKFYPGKSGQSPWSFALALIYELFLVINSSVNTLVYFTVNNGFRYQVLRLIKAPFRYVLKYTYLRPNVVPETIELN